MTEGQTDSEIETGTETVIGIEIVIETEIVIVTEIGIGIATKTEIHPVPGMALKTSGLKKRNINLEGIFKAFDLCDVYQNNYV